MTADRRFVRTAQDMAETLEGWIERLLTDSRRDKRGREGASRAGAAAIARRGSSPADARARGSWRKRKRSGGPIAFADWSAPGAKMSALVADYAGKIEKLNADINNDINADLAIFSFWFEIAPKHLQLRNEAARRRLIF